LNWILNYQGPMLNYQFHKLADLLNRWTNSEIQSAKQDRIQFPIRVTLWWRHLMQNGATIVNTETCSDMQWYAGTCRDIHKNQEEYKEYRGILGNTGKYTGINENKLV
jgi:hypothetical protein